MARVIVIGGGIAGVSVARVLARRGREVLLLERESQLGRHSSAVNAGIFRLTVTEPINVQLAVRSSEIGLELKPGGFINEIGGLYTSVDERALTAIRDVAGYSGVTWAAPSQRPGWLAAQDRPAIFSPHDGLIDVPGLMKALEADARNHGAQLRCGAEVSALERSGGRVSGVVVHGETIAGEVVDCSGAWSPLLTDGSARSIQPHRRHLFVLGQLPVAPVTSLVWDLTDSVYARPERDGFLISPCDEAPFTASVSIPTDPHVIELLRSKLARWAPVLSDAPIVRWWAGLRPLTADHKFLVGPDPLVPGLFLAGGFGGHGMTAGPAAGEMAAALLCGELPAGASELNPVRLSQART